MTGRNRVISISAFVAVAGLSAACVQILGIDSTTVADNSDDASPNDTSTTDVITNNDATTVDAGPYNCVGHPPNQTATPGTITLTADITDFFTKANAPGMQVFVCPESSDVGCSGVTGPYTSDEGGVASVPIVVGSGGFDGYLKVSGTVNVADPDGGHVETTVPYLWYFYAPIVTDGTYPLQVFATSEFAALLDAVGATNDPLRGQLAVQVTDCTNTPAANVELTTSTADDASTPFAIQGALPYAEPLPITDVSGLAGVFNLPAQTTLVTATPVSLGRPSGKHTLLIRAGSLTTIRLQPNL